MYYILGRKCKNFKVGHILMLCSGNTIGSHENILLNYLDTMKKYFHEWNKYK